MAMTWTTVLATCFLVGSISTAPTPSPHKSLINQLSLLYQDVQDECAESKLGPCGDEEITKVRFFTNCTEAIHENMFCDVKAALKKVKHTACDGVMPNITISRLLLGNQANCTLPKSHDVYTLKTFCSLLNRTVDHMYRNCYKD